MTASPPPHTRHATLLLRSSAAGALLLASSMAAMAQAETAPPTIEALNQRLEAQARRTAEMRRQLDAEEASLQALRAVAQRVLDLQRGTGAGANASAISSEASVLPQDARAAAAAAGSATVTQGPDGAVQSTPAAPIFEESGILTPKGGIVLEPSVQYSYSSNNRVTLLGYTILPALVVGLVDVREVKRNTVTGAVGLRYGLSSKFELEARVPYIYRSDTTRSRPYGAGSPDDTTVNAHGRDIGDLELAARYQLTDGTGKLPIMVGSLRAKSRTGTDPFEVVSDCSERCVGNATGTGQPLQLPTGSGFYSLQPGLTWLVPSDPAVLFGSFSYLHSFARTVSRRVLNGEFEPLGRIAPGDVFGFNVGIGLALNDKSSFSIGYDHSSVAATRQNGQKVSGSVRTQLGTLLFGYAYQLENHRSLNFSIGAGLTADTPGVTLALKMPMSF